MDIAALKEKLGNIPDPRGPWGNLRHKLEDILVIVLATLLCNGEDDEDMEAFGLEREAELRKFLELPQGILDESTVFRAFQRINPKELSACLCSWVMEGRELRRPEVNIDGKTIRGSGKRGDGQIVLGQVAADEKSNAITAIPKLLDLLDISEGTVTIDAMGCQTEIAKQIRKKQADYIRAVQDNQKSLHEDIQEYFEGLGGRYSGTA
jgi:hypothetical protein